MCCINDFNCIRISTVLLSIFQDGEKEINLLLQSKVNEKRDIRDELEKFEINKGNDEGDDLASTYMTVTAETLPL